jgi:hypothetical protein
MCDRDDCEYKDSFNEKFCTCCKNSLHYNQFSYGSRKKDFHQPWCKWCMSHYMKYVYPFLNHHIKCVSGRNVFLSLETAQNAFPWIAQDMSGMVISYCIRCTFYHVMRNDDFIAHVDNYHVEQLTLEGGEKVHFFSRLGHERQH